MIDLKQFKRRFQVFERLYYAGDFAGFWKWKLRNETKNEHILDDKHRKEAHHRLCRILPGWLTYRPYDSATCLEILEISLKNMFDAYNQIRHYSLLEFDKIPNNPLELIWHELGRAKEENGKTNSVGLYYIVAISKPFMFLWGQTLAFDSIVRSYVPRSLNVSKGHNWVFDKWKSSMRNIQKFLKQQPEVIELFKKVSREKYGTDHFVPYGQFMDLYYWVEGKACA
jgi:hypothetical protein